MGMEMLSKETSKNVCGERDKLDPRRLLHAGTFHGNKMEVDFPITSLLSGLSKGK